MGKIDREIANNTRRLLHVITLQFSKCQKAGHRLPCPYCVTGVITSPGNEIQRCIVKG